jgi:hypothetical protein
MTVKELKEILNEQADDLQVVIRAEIHGTPANLPSVVELSKMIATFDWDQSKLVLYPKHGLRLITLKEERGE